MWRHFTKNKQFLFTNSAKIDEKAVYTVFIFMGGHV